MTAYPESLDVRPLTTWPGALTPDDERARSQFSATLASTLEILDRELWHLDAQHPVLEVAITDPAHWRQDGRPRANARPEHPGVVLSLPSTNVGPLRYAVDRFLTWQENLRAIALALEALRKVERYGVIRRGEQYVGFRALPAGGGLDSQIAAVRMLARWSTLSNDEVIASPERAHRAARAAAHPDRNDGDQTGWDAVEAAARVLGVTT